MKYEDCKEIPGVGAVDGLGRFRISASGKRPFLRHRRFGEIT